MSMIRDTFYLVLAQKVHAYQGLTARLTAKPPRLDAGEVALTLNVEVPIALFKRPMLIAKVAVPDGAGLSERITADVQDNLALILSEQLGMRVRVSAEDVED